MLNRLAGLFLVLLIACFGLKADGETGIDADAISAPQTITVGVYVNDIQTIDLASYSYALDFYLWFRWTDPDIDPTEGFELMNMFDPEGHVETKLYDEPVPQPDGSLYQIIRHQGLFSGKFDLRTYPFDRQVLRISVEDSTEGSGTLRYVADTEAITLNAEVRLPGYDIGAPFVIIRDKAYATAFGDLAEPDVSAYSRADFTIPVSRPALAGVFKAFVPVLLIILSAAFALLLDPTHVEARIGLAITALLTLVAMQFTMQSGLPEVAYLTLLDQVYLASYLYILTVIGLVVRGTRIDEQGALQGRRGATAKLAAGGPIAATIVTGAYVLAVGVIVAVNLSLGSSA